MLRLPIYIAILLSTLLLPSTQVALQKDDVIVNPIRTTQKPLNQASFQLASKLDTIAIPQAVVPSSSISGAVSNCGDNSYANFIYMHESGCSTTATNSQGCYGIGQDCNGIVRSLCGSDYACENQYFTNYALSRYGSWANAASVWQSNGWW